MQIEVCHLSVSLQRNRQKLSICKRTKRTCLSVNIFDYLAREFVLISVVCFCPLVQNNCSALIGTGKMQKTLSIGTSLFKEVTPWHSGED